MSTDSDLALSVRGVGKAFGPTVALDGVDFSLRGGEVVALLGDVAIFHKSTEESRGFFFFSLRYNHLCTNFKGNR